MADFGAALAAAHNPVHDSDLERAHPRDSGWPMTNLLANQLALLLIRANLRGGKGRAIFGTGA
jgi:hypothetical protein